MDGLAGESQNLVESVKLWLSQRPQLVRLVLVIDQFEELFTVCAKAVRQDFINQFTRLPGMLLPVIIIVVMRDDFYNQFVEQTVLRQWLENSGGAVNVPQTLTRDEVTAIVQEPAESMGWKFEDGLIEIIVKDTLETTAPPEDEEQGPVARSTILPLLELALTQLWEKCNDQTKMLTHAAYEDIGGVTGCLTRWANQVFRELGDEEKQREARRVLTELVFIGDENQRPPDSRRRMPLASLSRNEHEFEKMIQQLASSKLLVTAYDIERKQEMVEIIHDALLWEWRQMRTWLQEDRRFLLWRQELERQVHAWIESNVEHPGRRDKYKLYRGFDLNEARRWLQERPYDLNQAEQEFIQASSSWGAQRRRLVIGIASGVPLVAAVGGGITWWVSSNHTYADIFTYSKHIGSVYCVAWSPDATRLASGSSDRKVYVYGSTGQDKYQHTDHTRTVTALAWSPNGYWIASASADATVHVWISAPAPDEKTRPELYKYTYSEHSQAVLAVTWSPDPNGQYIASGSMDQTIRGWQSGASMKELNRSVAGKDSFQILKGHKDSVNAVAWSPDGKYLASGSGDDTVKVWDVSQLEDAFKTGNASLEVPVQTFRQPSAHVLGLAWSPDSKYIASAGYDTAVHVWSLEADSQIFLYQRHGSYVTSIAWSADGQYIASASDDKTVRVWEALTGKTICVYREHNAGVNSVSWAPKRGDTRIASAGDDKKVRVWKLL